MKSLLGRVKAAYQSRRDAWPWFDHLVRAAERYKGDGGDRLAAALTMYSILALLPLLLVAMSVLGFVMAKDPDAQTKILIKVTGVIPGVGKQLNGALEDVEGNRGTLGAVGLVGLLFSGLGGVTALRDALRLMWHQNIDMGSFLKKKGYDALTLVILAVALSLSFGVSVLATGGAGALLQGAGVGSGVTEAILEVLSFVAGVFVDAVLFLVLFKWLPRVTWPWRRLVRGALFGGFLFGVLKLAGGWYVARTATKSTALYGSIGTAVALLVGLYLVSRVILFTAAWTVTAPGWHDVEPSGTASPEAAREAGIPEGEARGGDSYNGGTSPPDTNVPGRTLKDRAAREAEGGGDAKAQRAAEHGAERAGRGAERAGGPVGGPKAADWDRKRDPVAGPAPDVRRRDRVAPSVGGGASAGGGAERTAAGGSAERPAGGGAERAAVAAATGFGATLLAAKALKSLRRD
ncbi:MAG TPA: YhjD/YihY/BrkB family envelope integrity protein [Mycobacteriales bacterium]|jgi:membrane protein